MIKEFCAENHTDVARALARGAQRIELCDNLAVGGTTPSLGVIEAVCQLAQEYDATVVTMIRPRGGDFYYDEREQAIMKRDSLLALEAGSQGLVIGALTTDNWLDEAFLLNWLECLPDCERVFHMAFDLIPRMRQKEAIDWLANHGFTRILTHGGSMDRPIAEHMDWLKELIAHADQRLTILIGGGITADNCEQIAAELGLSQVHGTKIV